MHVTGLLVCSECWDPDQPQNQLGRFPVSDPQALRNPRPTGESGGRVVAGSLSYDFSDGIDGFTVTEGSLSSSGGNLRLDVSASSASSILSKLGVSIDTSKYRYIRMKVRFPELVSSPNQAFRVSWFRSGDSGYEPAIEDTDLDLNGNLGIWRELSWDTQKDKNVSGGMSDWSGTVEKFRFEFFGNIPDSTTVIEIDWIRFEPGYLGQGD